MNVNKKLDRFKQWAGERMGGEVKTNVSDDFKAMEFEMGLRQEGLEKMQKAMNGYVKAISKRAEVDTKDKPLPVAYLGGIMISHGEEFEPDSEFGQSLSMFGRTQERLARAQETYVVGATTTWLESLERSTVQMKEYQSARKKLDTRRLAYDTSLAKVQKAKKEDFRVEEELRSQRAKYEESEDDVHRRMQEIRDSDPESVVDLAAFLDAQLDYHEQCREALLRLRSEWPARTYARTTAARLGNRSRANTARSYGHPYEPEEETSTIPEVRPTIRSARTTNNRFPDLMNRDTSSSPARPPVIRSTTYDQPSVVPRKLSPPQMPRIPRVPSDSLIARPQQQSNLRVPYNNHHEGDVFGDDSTTYSSSSPEQGYNGYPVSPATSHGSDSYVPLVTKKGAPPAPPSRLKKPPPPPPPAKRSILT